MPTVDISVSDFARFVGARSPATRLQAVRNAKRDYEPAQDFYRGLREAIMRGHAANALEDYLRQAVRDAHPRRQAAYQECASAYLRFTRRRTFEYDRPARSGRWIEGDLRVRVNPEIVARIAGKPYVLKLWLSQPPGKQDNAC
jgi:hypothetical protein